MSFLWAHCRTLARSGLMSGLALWLVLTIRAEVVAAHAGLAESNPPDRALLDEPPEQVSLRFTQELDTSESSLAVFDRNGGRVDLGDGRVDLNDLDHQTMVVSLPPSLASGKYTVRWTAVSADDGDAIDGAISFTVGGPVAVGEATAADANRNPSSQSRLTLLALIVIAMVGTGAVYIGWRRGVLEKNLDRNEQGK